MTPIFFVSSSNHQVNIQQKIRSDNADINKNKAGCPTCPTVQHAPPSPTYTYITSVGLTVGVLCYCTPSPPPIFPNTLCELGLVEFMNRLLNAAISKERITKISASNSQGTIAHTIFSRNYIFSVFISFSNIRVTFSF